MAKKAAAKVLPVGAAVPAAGKITPLFLLVFITVVVFTLLAFAADVVLSTFPAQTDESRQMLEMCGSAYRMGFGAIVGLIGGKSFG